jgi:hypothetical protein
MCQHKRSGACGLPITVLNSKGTLYHFRGSCGCWSCPYCVETTLRERLLLHVLKIANRPLHHIICLPSEWSRFYNRIRGKRYFRIRVGDRLHIFMVAPMGERMDGMALRKLIEKIVKSIPYEVCPYNSCRAWAMHVIRQKKDCLILGVSNLTNGQVQTAAQVLGYKAKEVGEILTVKGVDGRAAAVKILLDARAIQAEFKAAQAMWMTSYPKTLNSKRHYDNSFGLDRDSGKQSVRVVFGRHGPV